MKHSQVCNGGLARFVALKTMDELCPLCLKMGNNKRIKAVQINLEEAVWMCENEECPWPFGYETPVFLTRKVGCKHSSEWEIYKKVQKRVGPIPVSTELSLYTPPVTPSSDTITKESAKSHFSGVTNISEQISQVGSILGCTNDSYAPKSNFYEDHAVNENKIGTQALNACVENQAIKSCAVSQKVSIAQSIFDIDSNELMSDKISIEDFCSEPKEPDLPLALLETPDVKKETTETVLETFGNKVSPEDLKLKDETKEIDMRLARDGNAIKTMPQVKKISKANIYLHMIDRRKIVAVRKSAETRKKDLSEKIKADVTEKIKAEDSSLQIDSDTHKSDVSMKQQTLDDTETFKQHTTTITVDGSLPITLTYDLMDLEEKSEVKIPNSSMPISESTMNILHEEKEQNTSAESLVESPTKRIRPPAKRRAALTGKRYEKFSFVALKKCEKNGGIKDCDDKSSCTIVSPNERVQQLEEIQIVKDENCSIGALGEIVDNGVSRASNQHVESMDLKNVDPTNLKTIGDDSLAENFNLSALDDLLIDGYQNASANLNDEWLESFLTNLDT